MKVGLIVPGFSADPGDWCIPALRDLICRLATMADLHIFALRYPYRPARYQLFGAEVTALGGGEAQGWDSAAIWRRTASAVVDEHGKRRFDVLHAFWAGEPGFVTALLGRALGVPTIVSLAGGELARLRDINYGGRLRFTERMKTWLALRLGNLVTAGSAQLLLSASSWLGASAAGRLRRMPLGVDLARFTPSTRSPHVGPSRLLNVASLSPVKDQATLLFSAARLQQRGYGFELEIIGSGPLEFALRSLARRLGIDGSVRWRGQVAHDQLPDEYSRGNVFALSSRHEAQGMVVLEAAACGLPIVGTRVGVVPEFAAHGACVTPVGAAEGLADGIAKFLDDDQAAVQAGGQGRQLVEAEFALEACARGVLRLYAEARGAERSIVHEVAS